MHKKIMAACVSLVAFAAFAALPSFASAAPCVTDPAGTCLATGNKLLITQHSEIKLVTSSGTVTCTKAKITGTLLTNDKTNGIAGTITTADFTGDDPVEEKCTSTISDLSGGTATMKVTQVGTYCLNSTANDIATVTQDPGGAGACHSPSTVGAKFIFDVTSHTGTNLGSCEYQRQTGGVSAGLTATYNTGVAPATGTFQASQTFKKISGAFFCPGEGTLEGQFTVFTDNEAETGVSIS